MSVSQWSYQQSSQWASPWEVPAPSCKHDHPCLLPGSCGDIHDVEIINYNNQLSQLNDVRHITVMISNAALTFLPLYQQILIVFLYRWIIWLRRVYTLIFSLSVILIYYPRDSVYYLCSMMRWLSSELRREIDFDYWKSGLSISSIVSVQRGAEISSK